MCKSLASQSGCTNIHHYTIAERKLFTCVSRSDEESVEGVGEAVSMVLKETDPEKSPFPANPILAFNSLKPKGHPSSCIAPKPSNHNKKIKRYKTEYEKLIFITTKLKVIKIDFFVSLQILVCVSFLFSTTLNQKHLVNRVACMIWIEVCCCFLYNKNSNDLKAIVS